MADLLCDIQWQILFLATIGTTLWAGYRFSTPLVKEGLLENSWAGVITFSFGLLAIIGCHEMGHKLTAERGESKLLFPILFRFLSFWELLEQ